MAFRLDPRKSPGRELTRAICRQLKRAIKSASDQSLPTKTRVHAARVACKKARAALKLIQDARPNRYARENAVLRDAARLLSPLRDADAVMDSFQLLLGHCGDQLGSRQIAVLRRAVTTAQRDCRLKPAEVHQQLSQFVTRIRAALKRWQKWENDGLEIDDILCGYRETYRRNRRALRAVRKDRDTTSFHEWRKLVKAQGYQSRLLRCAWPPLMKKQNRQLARLGNLLGEDRDLTVLQSRLKTARSANEAADPLDATLHTIRERCDSLRAEALPLGAHLFAEKPAAMERRMRQWWKVGEN